VELQIPFQSYDEKSDVFLRLQCGFSFYLVLANGTFCILLSLVIFLLDLCFPDEMCQFFGIDPLTIYEECLLSKYEYQYLRALVLF